MSKFEKIFKDAVEGYEAPFDPKAWDDLSNDLNDSFDQAIKESTSNYEAPYNPSAWEAVSSQLEPAHSTWKWIAGAAAVVAVVAGTSYFSDNTENEKTLPTSTTSTEVADNDIVKDKTITPSAHYDNITDETTSEEEINPVDDNNTVDIVTLIDPEKESNDLTYIDVDDSEFSDLGNGDVANEVNEEISDDTDESNIDVNTTNENNEDVSSAIHYKATADFEVQDAVVCVGDVCVFTPGEVNSKLIYVWNFGDGAISGSSLGKHKYKRSGEYEVILNVKHPNTNKTLASASKTILVNSLPKTDFSWEQASEAIPTVQFINLTDEAASWNWNIKGVKQSSKNEFEHTFRKAGNYTVELTAVNAEGCKKSVQKSIKIDKDYNLLAPTAFTPDGDGDNDYFIPEALKLMDVDFTMTIMDKNGKPVYSTRNAFEPWDGRYTQDNTLAPNGSSYIWRVILTNKNGEREMYEGQVFVIR